MTWKSEVRKAIHTIRRFLSRAKRFCCEGEAEKIDPRDQLWEKAANALHTAIKRFGQGESVDTDTLTEIVKVGAFLGRKNKTQLQRIVHELNECMDLAIEANRHGNYILPADRETLGAICKCYMMLDKGVRR